MDLLTLFHSFYLISAHCSYNITKSSDTFTDKFVKKWTGLPPCATNAALNLKPGLDITPISTQYKTTMAQAYTRIRILGVETVNSALQSKLDRGKKLAPQNFHHRLCRTNVSTTNFRELWSRRNAWVGRQSFLTSMLQKMIKKLSVKKYLLKMKLSGNNIQKHSQLYTKV